MVNGKEIKPNEPKMLLPNKNHPYDHYVTVCELAITKND